MKKQILMVKKFHEVFGPLINDTPTLIDDSRENLRYNLIEEELEEYKQACKNKDLVKVADALCDILYVTFGTIIEHGLTNDIERLFEEVQRSNMSKACKTKEEAIKIIEKREKEFNEKCSYEKIKDYFVVFRCKDKKIMKSENYSPPKLNF